MYACSKSASFSTWKRNNSIHYIENRMRGELSIMPQSLPGARRREPELSLSLSLSL